MKHRISIVCINCWTHHTEATSSNGKPPQAGDYLLCQWCGWTLIYDPTAQTGVHKPTEAELKIIDKHEGFQEIRCRWINENSRWFTDA